MVRNEPLEKILCSCLKKQILRGKRNIHPLWKEAKPFHTSAIAVYSKRNSWSNFHFKNIIVRVEFIFRKHQWGQSISQYSRFSIIRTVIIWMLDCSNTWHHHVFSSNDKKTFRLLEFCYCWRKQSCCMNVRLFPDATMPFSSSTGM